MLDSYHETKSKVKTKLIVTLLISSFLISYLVVNTQKNHQLMIDARKLNSVVLEPFEWIETISIHMGKLIIEHNNPKDLKFIDKLFKETLKIQGVSNHTISWPGFSWGNKDYKLVVNSLDGVIKKPEDLIDRQCASRTSYTPWSLQIAKTSRGMLSNMVVVPVAVGTTDIRDQFQGLVISGINVKELLNRAESVVTSGNAFLVVNRDPYQMDSEKIILSSANSPSSSDDYEKISDLVAKLRDWVDPAGSLPTSIEAGRYKYSYYRLVEGYQLAIFVGFNRLEFWGKVLALGIKFFVGSLAVCFVVNEVGYLRRARQD